MNFPKINFFGESALLLQWQPVIDAELSDQIIAFEQALLHHFQCQILETVSTYNALAIYLKQGVQLAEIAKEIQFFSRSSIPVPSVASARWKIPVCYDLQFGLDLEEISQLKGISVDELISLHTNPTYRLYFMGFLPGFMYLGGLNEQLTINRKTTPRPKIEKGSVAIGGNQTGIYPAESPGGWQIIGRTPLELFNATYNPPVPFNPGDSIHFYPISISEFEQLKLNHANGLFESKATFLL